MKKTNFFEVTIFDEVDGKLKKEIRTFKNQMKGMTWAFAKVVEMGFRGEINFDDKMCVILVPRWPKAQRENKKEKMIRNGSI